MPQPVQYLSPRQLASALDVSESTIKRWVDAGRIPAGRTRGGHRRISLSAALAFIRDASVRLANPAALGLDPERVTSTLREAGVAHGTRRGAQALEASAALTEQLGSALVAGDVVAARSVMIALHVAGWSSARFIDGPIAQAMTSIGELYQHGREGIFSEHRATAIALQLMAELHGLIESAREDHADAHDDAAPRRPTAVGGAPDDDVYLLPSCGVSLVLTEAGFEVTNLGPMTPLDVLHEGARQLDARIVWLSVSTVDPLPDRGAIHELAEALDAEGRALVVGGRAHAALELDHPNIYLGSSMIELDAYARGIVRQLRHASP